MGKGKINVSVEKLKDIGYIKDIFGVELSSDEQIIELMPQDLILPSCSESLELGSDEILLKTITTNTFSILIGSFPP